MTGPLAMRDPDDSRYDVVTLGEVMLRLDPGEGRVRTTRNFAVSEGGGEYNVGRGLRRCFGRRVAHVTALADNEIGRLLEDLLLQGGVGLDHVVWKEADEIGRHHRTPLNFTERGFGVRSSVGVYDRAHSATAALAADDVDWDQLFGELGARWFHTGGIFAGLSESTFEVARLAMQTARRHGATVSYDINYRPSLWRASGGPQEAWRRTLDLLDDVDVLFGIGPDELHAQVDELASDRPLAVVATTRRVVHSASSNDLGALGWSRSTGVVEGPHYERLAVLDRVGSGDGFAAGVIHALLDDADLSVALAYGLAHAALVMTTPGDTSMADVADVERVMSGSDAEVQR